jgi:peptidoglycan/xylan/chitin deacetylase (PgdA/CDA1 family)
MKHLLGSLAVSLLLGAVQMSGVTLSQPLASFTVYTQAAAGVLWDEVPVKTAEGKPYQYVVFAFDGSRSLGAWRETLDFAKQMSKPEQPFHFTYFINASYLLSYVDRMVYQAPYASRGESNIGFGGSAAEVGERIARINEAYAAGHEIGSHTVGHYAAHGWSEADWASEFTQFNEILESKRQGVDTATKLEVLQESIRAFRAPELVVGMSLDVVLDRFGFSIDASHPRPMGTWPYTAGSHIEMPLAVIPYTGADGRGRELLAMDYNFYLNDTRAHDTLKKGTLAWNEAYKEMLAAYKQYFIHNYTHDRAPVFIGHHFSEWNDGLYWDVLKAAAAYMCTKPDVRCATYSETAEYLMRANLLNAKAEK